MVGWGEEVSISSNPAPTPILPNVIPPCHPTPDPGLVLAALHLTLSPSSKLSAPVPSEPSLPKSAAPKSQDSL